MKQSIKQPSHERDGNSGSLILNDISLLLNRFKAVEKVCECGDAMEGVGLYVIMRFHERIMY